MGYLFPFIFLGVFAYLLYIMFTKHGRGVILGGKIVKTLNDEIKQREGIRNTTIRVHVIERKKQLDNSIAIALNQHMYLAWNIMPIRLTKGEARQLVAMLEEAIL